MDLKIDWIKLDVYKLGQIPKDKDNLPFRGPLTNSTGMANLGLRDLNWTGFN